MRPSRSSTGMGYGSNSSRRSPNRNVGRDSASTASTCLAPSIPVRTSADAMPARLAPRMSVSSRSPRTRGWKRTKALDSSVENGPLRLSGDKRKAPHRCVNGGHQRAVSGRRPAGLGNGPVGIRRHPRDLGSARTQGKGRLGQVGPCHRRVKTLDDGGRSILRRPCHPESVGLDHRRQALSADDKDGGPRRNELLKHHDRCLRRGHDIVGRRPVSPSSEKCSATDSAVRDALLVIYPTGSSAGLD